MLETQWCVTLDRVPEALYPEIAAGDAQRREWVELFAIDEIAADLGNGGAGYGEPLSAAFLEANPHLVLDTRHFDAGLQRAAAGRPLRRRTAGRASGRAVGARREFSGIEPSVGAVCGASDVRVHRSAVQHRFLTDHVQKMT